MVGFARLACITIEIAQAPQRADRLAGTAHPFANRAVAICAAGGIAVALVAHKTGAAAR